MASINLTNNGETMRTNLKAVPATVPATEKAIDTLMMGIEAVSELMTVALNSKHQVVDPITIRLLKYRLRTCDRLPRITKCRFVVPTC